MVDSWFVDRSVQPMPKPEGNGYANPDEGWQIHLNRTGYWKGLLKDSYSEAGAGGGIIYVCPSLNIVIALNGTPPDPPKDGWYKGIHEYLKPIIDTVIDN